MLTLAFDTSAKTIAVAILQNENILYEIIINTGFHHTEILMPAIDRACRESRIKIQDVDLFACTLGPGSFTGLRIGISTLKGLLAATGKPAAGISSLAALALNVEDRVSLIGSVMDAGRGQVYTAYYRYNDHHLLIPASGEQLVHPEKIVPDCEKDLILVGDGAIKYRGVISKKTGKLTIASSMHQHIRASSVGILGLEKFSRNQLLDLNTFVPHYLRGADAQPKKNLFEN